MHMGTDERMKRAPRPWEITSRIFIVVGLFAAIAGGVLYEVRREWDAAVLSTLVAGAVTTILCIALNFEWVLRAVIQKKMLLNLNMIVMILFALGMAAGINYYSYRHHAREDASGRYKLSEQTRNMLGGLPKTVRAYTFFSSNARAYQDFQFVEMARDVINEYAAISPNMEVQHIDVMREGKNVMYVRDGLGVDSIDLNSIIFASGDLNLMDAKAAAGKALAYAEAKNQIEEQIDEFKSRGLPADKLKSIRSQADEQLAEIELTGRDKAAIKDSFPNTYKALEGFFDGKVLTKEEIIKIRDDMPKVKIRTKVVRGYDMYSSQQGRGEESQPVFKGEEEFTTAVMSVADEKPAQVYFLTGHGERRIDGSDEFSYRDFSEELKKSNVEFKTLDLNEEGKVPDNCSVLVIAGPANGIPTFHLKMIESYLERKSSADVIAPSILALVDPVQRRDSGLQELLARYNIDLLERVRLIDVTKVNTLDPRTFKVVTQERPSLTVEVSEYGDHPAVAALDGFPAAFADVACVRPTDKNVNVDIRVLSFLNSNEKAWGETNFRKLVQSQEANFEPDEDIKGPVPFGVIAESSKKDGPRLIVIGDSDFGSSSFINQAAGNRGLAINSTLWLARKDNRLGLPPVDMDKASWQLTSENEKTLGLVARFGLPAGWIFFGLGVWMIRAVMTTNSNRKSLVLRFVCVFGVLLAILGGIGYASDTTVGLTTGLIVLGIVLIAVGIGFNLAWFKQMAIERKAMYGTNVAVMVLLGVFITGVVNYSAARGYERLDITAGKRYALDDETIAELKKVDRRIDATMIMPVQFFNQVAYFASMHMQEMQEEFRRHAPNVAFNTVYNTKEGQEQIRLLSEQLKTRFTRERIPLVLFSSSDNVKQVDFESVIELPPPPMQSGPFGPPPQQDPPKLVAERAFLDAILTVGNDERVTLYFSVGNGERHPEKFGDQDFGEFAKLLKRANFSIKTIDLNKEDTVPSDCHVLVLAAPKVTYSSKAKSVITGHLNNEGALMVFAEPEIISGTVSGLEDILLEYDIRLEERSMVVDMRKQLVGFDPRRGPVVSNRPDMVVQASSFGFHEITRPLEGNTVAFYQACNIDVKEQPPEANPHQFGGQPPQQPPSKWRTARLVQSTSEEGWIDRNLKEGDTSIKLDETFDTKGRGTVAVAVEPNNAPPAPPQPGMPPMPPPSDKEKKKGPRIVVFGDADLASDAVIRQAPGNEQFLMSSVRWTARQEPRQFDFIKPKELENRPLDMADASRKYVRYSVIFGLPLLMLVIAFGFWQFRRM